jgi:hypothetical protein
MTFVKVIRPHSSNLEDVFETIVFSKKKKKFLTRPCPIGLGHTKVKTSLTNFMDKIRTQKFIKKKKKFF